MFNFDHQFEIHDDVEVLRRMGHTYGLERGHCDIKVLKTVLGLMPTAVHRFITGLYGIENTTCNTRWRSGNALVSINEVNLHPARLVLGWVIVSRFNSWYWTVISICNQPSRPTQLSIPPGLVNEYQLRLGRKRQVWFLPLADERGLCR